MSKSRIFNIANMSFNTIRENKILAKISEFTVHPRKSLTFVNTNKQCQIHVLTKSHLLTILKDFRNAPPAKMLIYCQKNLLIIYENKIDKSRHLACIHQENRNAVVYGCRDVAIILRKP